MKAVLTLPLFVSRLGDSLGVPSLDPSIDLEKQGFDSIRMAELLCAVEELVDPSEPPDLSDSLASAQSLADCYQAYIHAVIP